MLSFGLLACNTGTDNKNEQSETPENETEEALQLQIDSSDIPFKSTPMLDTTNFDSLMEVKEEVGEFDQIEPKFTSTVRPNQPIFLNKTYTDTIEFSTYNDDYDYRMIIGKKNGKEVRLIYNWDWENNDRYNFKYGDLIKVEWKMDRIIHAGDEEIVDFSERVIDAERLESKSSLVKFLWREEKVDEETGQKFSSILINESFVNSITDQEKAALGYVATFIGNECSWDGGVNDDRSNLKCKILTALDLGYQCSEQHIGFLKRWFSEDATALEKLAICRTTPEGATVQTTFNEISIVANDEQNTIAVTYEVQGMNMRESSIWRYTQTDNFEYTKENIRLVASDKSEVIEENIEMTEN